MLISKLLALVGSFDDEDGVPESTYNATYELIEVILGTDAANLFSRYMDATDGRFYLKSEQHAVELLEEMVKDLIK